jgi:hypothetical protein
VELITRAEAKRRGLKRYYTGKPCKHGHVAERHVEGNCMECNRESAARWKAENRDEHLSHRAVYYERHRHKIKEYVRTRYNERMAEARVRAGGCCATCGATENLHFHHRDPSTKVDAVTNLVRGLEDAFWTEVEKCDLLCEACHRAVHHQMRSVVAAKATHTPLQNAQQHA